MFIVGNQVIARMCALNGMRYNQDGLSLVVDRGGFKGGYEILITSDEKRVCDCLDLDFDKILAANYDEFFKLVTESKYFFKEKFLVDASDGECKLLGLFSEFLATVIANGTYTSIPRERMTIEHILRFFKDENLTSNYTKVMTILPKEHLIRQNFNGKVILTVRPDYDKTKLNITMPYFSKEYPRIDREYLLVTGTPEEIVAEFERFTNHLL